MSDKSLVQSVIPSATCREVVTIEETSYVITAKDAHKRDYIVSTSFTNEDDAWEQVAETFRHKMINKLENAA